MKKYTDTGKKDTRSGFGAGLLEAGRKDPRVLALTADLKGSLKMDAFAAEFPERFIQCGIAEANMVGAAAGLAISGKIPFIGSFAEFVTGRVYDQVRQEVAYGKANVKIASSHAGITLGEDGGSHQAIEDIALMRVLPNMTVFVPSDANECYACVEAAAKIDGPVFIRTARLPSPVYDPLPFEVGKGIVLKEGKDGVLFTCGIMKEHALEAVDILAGQGIDLSLVTFHTIKPFDEELARTFAAKYKKVFTLEEHSIIGGLGDTVASAVIGCGVEKFHKIGIQDVFGQSGKPADLLKEYGLTGPQIAENIQNHL